MSLVPLEVQELPVLLEQEDPRELPEQLVVKGLLVQQELPVLLEQEVPQEQLVLQEVLDLQELQEPQV